MGSTSDNMVSIFVRDNGVGIAPDLLPVVFDLFTQSTRTLDRSQGGLGIGLTLVKSLVELHGGTIAVESEGLGHGSTFIVRLPVTDASALPEPEIPQATVSKSRRILAVDDNIGAAQMLAMLLRKLGEHEIALVHDGPSVLEMVRKFDPEIILLDIGLPGLDGYQVAKAIRQNAEFDELLLVALTGYGQEEDHRKSQEAGFDEHLVKPPSLDQVKKVLSHPKLATVQRPQRWTVTTPVPPLPRNPSCSTASGDGQPRNADEDPTFDPQRVRHDARNMLHTLKLIEQTLATPHPDAEMIQTAREGLKAEMERLRRLSEF